MESRDSIKRSGWAIIYPDGTFRPMPYWLWHKVAKANLSEKMTETPYGY